MNDQRPYLLPLGASRLKRKDREPLHSATRPPPPRPTVPATATTKPSTGSKITSSNKLLAGYMAYEFLTKGTLLGHELEAARSDTAVDGGESYKVLASLLMVKSEGGGCIQGIVNPTELRRWIEM